MKIRTILLFIFLCVVGNMTHAQSKKSSKPQEVNFDEMSMKGTVRNPEGAFLAQKRGNQFVPLTQIQKDVDRKIRESANYVR